MMHLVSPKSSLLKHLFTIILLSVFSYGSFAQTVRYVGDTTISGGNTSFYFTKSVTLLPGTHLVGSSEPIFISPIPTNPPPSTDQNFVRTEVPKIAVTSESTLTTLSADDKSVYYDYSDGLGRASMSAAAEGGPGYEDIIQHHDYNQTTGRPDQSYLPYSSSAGEPGEFRLNAETETTGFYGSPPSGVTGDLNPYSQATFEDSPLNRVSSVTGEGADWHGNNKSADADYFLYEEPVDVNLRVINWKIGLSGTPERDNYHPTLTLQISESISEEGIKTQSVVDSRGRTIAVRSWETNRWITTYYIYDVYNRLRFILPPAIANEAVIDATELANFAFQYEYDYRGRLKIERNPGAGEVRYVYDNRNRLVFSQDEVQRSNNQWIFRKYDKFNRLIMTGVDNSGNTQTQWETSLKNALSTEMYEDTNSSATGYTTGNSYPKNNHEILAITYYDDYNFKAHVDWDTDLSPDPFDYTSSVSGLSLPVSNHTAVKGLTTGSKVKILGTSTWLNTVIYYDDEYRTIQVVSENHLTGHDRISNQLHDFNGILEKMKLEHAGTENVDLLSEYEYDHEFRLLKTYQQINSEPRVLVADYRYNVLGQLVEKNLHSTDDGSSYLQSVDYSYNIRGWLSSINSTDLLEPESSASSDLFGMNFHYSQAPTIGITSTPRYDGAVAAMSWNYDHSPLEAGIQGGVKTITGYQYDELSRLDGTNYATDNAGAWNNDLGHFDVNPGYDDNGNLLSLTRKSEDATIDNLVYDYENAGVTSNKLLAVTDTGGTEDGFNNLSRTGGTPIDMLVEYEYDNNGNLTRDQHKEMSITYNVLQLPSRMDFDNGSSLVFLYDAAGNRLAKTITYSDATTERMDYVGLVEYMDNEVYQLFTDEGRAFKQNQQYFYEYFITDHQANNRLAFGVLPKREVFLANMENGASDTEFAFPSTPDVREVGENKTTAGLMSARLNGSDPNYAVGPAKVLTIAAQDEVEIEVWAKYNASTIWNNTSIADIATLVSSVFGGASAGTGAGEASGSLSSTLASPPPGLFTGNNNPAGEPEAYLQYMFFDANHNFVATGSGFIPVTNDSNGSFGRMTSGKLTYSEPGYLFIYIANESNQNDNVYFDDLSIVHESAESSFKVSQVNDYYPFGMLTTNSWRNPGYEDPGMLYQSYFNTYDSLSETHDFFLRNYDPALGRWMQTDPYNQFASPYVGMGNGPHMGVDPDGGFWFGAAIGGIAAALAADESGASLTESFFAGLGGAFFGGFVDHYFSSVASGGLGHNLSGLGNSLAGIGNFLKKLGGGLQGPTLGAIDQLAIGVVTETAMKLGTPTIEVDPIMNLGTIYDEDHINFLIEEYNREVLGFGVLTPQELVARIHQAQADFDRATGLSTLITLPAGGAVFGSIGRLGSSLLRLGRVGNATVRTGRVFWSGGGNPAVEATARQFATKNGLTTLEMTRAGRNLTSLTRGMSRAESTPMWNRLSAQFAKGATGEVHVFQNAGGIRVGSTFGKVEYPILKSSNVKIIFHNIK